MTNPDRQSKPVIHRSEQNVQNSSFDETYQVTATEMLVENSAQTALVRLNEDMLGGSSGVAAFSDSGGTDRKGLVDADRHPQVDVLTLPAITGSVTANAGTNLNTSTLLTELDFDTKTGSLTETAPASDTASSGLNGRLQRIAQRLTTIISLLPGSLGQKARAASLAVTLSSEDISAITPPAAITGFATETTLTAIKDTAGIKKITDALPAGTNNIGDVDVITLPGIAGDVPHDTADSGNPVKIGGKVTTSTPTPLTNGKRTDAAFDEYSRMITTDRDPETGYSQGTTSLRDRLVVQRYTVIADSVADGLNGLWTLSTTGTGVTPTVVAGSGEGTLQTSAAINSSSQMVSTVLRYHPGQESWFNSAFRFAAATTGNTQRIGACTVSGTTPQDGFYYERNGTTFDAVVVKAGVEFSRVASTSWTRVTQAPFTFDTNYHSFEFRFTANGVSFYVDNILRHRVTGGGTTLTSTLDFPMFIQNVNTTNNTNVTVAIRNVGMGRFGTPPTEYTSGSILADQTGAASVRTFTFTTPVDFIWVTDIGTTTTNVSRVDPFGGTPAATTGIPVLNGAPTPINVVPASSTIRVYVPVGSTIAVHGFRYM